MGCPSATALSNVCAVFIAATSTNAFLERRICSSSSSAPSVASGSARWLPGAASRRTRRPRRPQPAQLQGQRRRLRRLGARRAQQPLRHLPQAGLHPRAAPVAGRRSRPGYAHRRAAHGLPAAAGGGLSQRCHRDPLSTQADQTTARRRLSKEPNTRASIGYRSARARYASWSSTSSAGCRIMPPGGCSPVMRGTDARRLNSTARAARSVFTYIIYSRTTGSEKATWRTPQKT